MKKYVKPLALVLAVILCVGALAACTTTTTKEDDDDDYADTGTTAAPDDTADDATDDSAQDATADDEVQEDVIGKITEIYDSMLTLDSYTAASEITDYAALDVTTLTATGETEYPYIYEDCEYYRASEGTLADATDEDLTVGQTVAVITTEDGVQQVIILQDAEADGATIESYPVIAEVNAIADDGTWTLYIYALNSDVTDYEITDYANVELDNYTYAFDSLDYLPTEGITVQFASEDTLTDAVASDVAVGDMVVIYTDEAGNEKIAVYPTTAEIVS